MEKVDIKKLIFVIGFSPKENASDIFIKQYPNHNYFIEVDFSKKLINYGEKIKSETKTTQNFSQSENFVVLECVNRLLEKGYKPENITLEKIWRTGHGTSGRLDILVTQDDGSAFMMIECKNWGAEFNKEFKNIEKNGGQLFTYFQQDRSAEVLMLYTSGLDAKGKLQFENQIIKIEDDYRLTTNVKDFYERWNKIPKNNGVFEDWVNPYHFESKALTINQLSAIKQEDSSFIFNRFLEILRHNVVSDKGNAFNRIFTLFLCKIYDEKVNEGTNNELAFQWFYAPFQYNGTYYEKDDHKSFQLRLTDLYKNGMYEFLEKVVTDFSETEFKNKFPHLTEEQRNPIIDVFRKIRLEKNNEFAIKDVFDERSFYENAVVVKEIVELLQGYQVRYTKKQQYLSDFFELLLTTGLKQESGQFFTPVPVAQFVIKSLPIDKMVEEKLSSAKLDNDTLLPYVIDYAAGSGHFVTEVMHVIQSLIDEKKPENYNVNVAKALKHWKDDHFKWAINYIYGIEKDYRLVKVGKVGCYLHGDGLANVIHSDGLAKYAHPDYKGKLKHADADFPRDNKQFDIVVSNPPYSVSSFKNASSKYYGQEDFELYERLTDNSSEIECLFIERTKQLLKDGGVAGIILPSSILSNTGIYTKAREIILQYFEIIGITELGSNTFMATGTNTVTLFLRRRSNYDSQNFEIAVEKFFADFQDVTVNQIEKPFSKYVNCVWEDCSLEDYKTLLQKNPNEKVSKSELYKDYRKKIKSKNENEFWTKVIETEKEKIYYFILAYPQKVVLVKSGEKDAEKRFLGYEFSNRRGSEGIHPIQRGKSIEECTQLFDEKEFENPEKASTYIYKAFNGDFTFPIDEKMQNNVSRADLVDMLTFDRVDFEKNISTSVKKKVKIESKWEQKKLSEILETLESGKRPKGGVSEYQSGIPSLGGEHIDLNGKVSLTNMKFVPVDFFNSSKQGVLKDLDILICKDGALTGKTSLFYKNEFLYDDGMINEHVFLLRTNQLGVQKYLFNILYSNQGQELLKLNVTGTAQGGLNRENLLNISIPLPPLEIQQKIVSEIEVLEEKEKNAREKVEKLKVKHNKTIEKINSAGKVTLEDVSENLDYLRKPITKGYREKGKFPYYGASGIVDYVSDFILDDYVLLVSEDGANLKARTSPIAFTAKGKIWVNNHAHILKFKDKATHKLVEIFLNSTDISEYITGQAQPKLNQQNLNSIKIPLPPLSEQQKIVSEIEKIEEEIKILETQIAEIPKQKEEILKKYL